MPWANFDDKLQNVSRAAAETLRRAKESILSTWGADTKKFVLHQHDLPSESQLRNSLPKLIDNLAMALEDPYWTYRERRNADIARYHGLQRQDLQRYSLEQMIDEYAILRKVLVAAMQERHVWPLSIMARVNAYLDAAIRVAADEFAQRQKHFEVSEVQDALHATSQDRDEHRHLVTLLEEEKILRARFVALLTHDLSNPLTAIKMSCQRIQKKSDDPALTLKLAERMEQATERMEQMIRDMLDTTRLQAGQSLPLRLQDCNLTDLIKGALDACAQPGADGIAFAAKQSVTGQCDADAVTRAVENLVGNALKYGSRDGPITVTLEAVDGQALISVHNFGPSIPADDLADVFEIYARAKRARDGKQQGWGLGLHLVKAVAEAHGGTVGATSHPNDGTTFWFKIPIDGRSAGAADGPTPRH